MRHHRRIIKSSLLLYTVIALFLYNCAPKAIKTATKEEYSEDLSAVRPPVDSVATLADKVDKIKVPYVEPENDITLNINSLVDSLSQDNRDKKVSVYTIQVYVGNNRNEANEARTKVYRVLQDETPRLEYSAPNYRVKVGSYLDRLDAHKTLTLLKKAFPGAILLTDKIRLKN